jgi:hypothetical protein
VTAQRILIDSRPGCVDHLFRPGSSFTVTFRFTAGETTGHTYTSVLGGQILDVDLDDDTVTVSATAEQTADVGGPTAWRLLEDDEELLIGTWSPSNSPRGSAR